MRPVVIGGCFGWLHAPSASETADVAVLLCPALCSDGLTAHRQFRLLAKSLANAGYPTLRFDYPGTGDSCDSECDADLWTIWLRSIHAAADWLRGTTGARRLVLCGLRLGATLAGSAAEQRADVAGLVLLAPIVRGRTFVSQMKIEAKLANSIDENGFLEVHGLLLSPATIRTIAAVELDRVVLPRDCAAAIFNQAPSLALERCAFNWKQNGAAVTQADFSGFEPMLRPRFMSHEAPAKVGRVTEWLCRVMPAVPAAASAAWPLSAILRPPGCEELPVRFGPNRSLFGILCRPENRYTDLAVVIVNGGGDPHHGCARASVDIARRFAAAGIASFRMDFAGLGDSVTPDDGETHVFETDRRADVVAAIETLAGMGFCRFAVNGLCSGAFHAFHAALVDKRIDTLLLINLPMFEWHTGDKVELLKHMQQSPLDFVGKLRSIDVWKRVLCGQLDIRIPLTVQGRWIAARLARLRARLTGFGSPRSFAQASAQSLSRHSRTLLLMAQNDSGLSVLAAEFGQDRAPPGCTLRVLPGIDHSLTRAAMRRAVVEIMIGFLTQ
jgi:alpha-beta hydrolase superfamily lysophospholipase